MAQKIEIKNPLFQSPYSYLQATGSDGNDGTAPGIHLRWDLLRTLGDQHLPKGDLTTQDPYHTQDGFNKEDDFVRIYRASYEEAFPIRLELADPPHEILEEEEGRGWLYKGFHPVQEDDPVETDVELRFLDATAYDDLTSTVSPMEEPLEFLRQYPAVIELFTVGKLMYKGVFDLEDQGEEGLHLKLESLSEAHNKFDRPDAERYFVSSRRKIERMDPEEDRTIVCENIDRFRFSTNGAYPFRVTLFTYRDHFLGVNAKEGWEFVGAFSLDDGKSDDNEEVFRRLEDPTEYVIDKKWPKYNQANQNTGAFTVRVANYEDRWTNPEGLKEAVVKYLTESVNDPKAKVTLPSDDPNDQAAVTVSYLNLLNIVALDFHIARMLGLGHIDKSKGRAEGQLDGGITEELLDVIADPENSSQQVTDQLIENAPLSEEVLIAAIERDEVLEDGHLKEILLKTPELSQDVLLATIRREVALKEDTLYSVLEANAPHLDPVLLELIRKRDPLSWNYLDPLLQMNLPLSKEVLLALMDRVPEGFGGMIEESSPVDDEVLLKAIDSDLSPESLRDVMLKNLQVSPVVENALKEREPEMPQEMLDEILNNEDFTGEHDPQKCIYLLEYRTLTHLEEFVPQSQESTHLYLSLPTDRSDDRLPPVPVLDPVSYGLEIDNNAGTGEPLTDPQGYAPFADQRVINLHRKPFLFEHKLRPFFDEGTPFEICHETPAVQLGVEYKLASELEFRGPEVNHDPVYADHSGILETTAIPRSGKDPFFIHKETEEGIHEYGAYSINWFSRASPVSNLVSTDETEFPERITLLPPSNFSVQLIQEEDPLIFTTSAEQSMLAALSTPDKTLVRVTFDWEQAHAKAYQFADRAEFFFREEPPRNVRGKVDSVTELSPGKVQVTTKSYTITSKSPAETVQPEIPSGEEHRYEGGLFNVGGDSFLVDSVVSSGTDPTLVLEQIKEPHVTDPDNDGQFSYTDSFVSPSEDSMFLLVEELDSGNWDSQLVRSAYLESFHTVHEVEVRNSSEIRNNKAYVVREVLLSGSDTELRMEEDIPVSDPNSLGDLVYLKKGVVVDLDPGNNLFKVDGDISGELSSGDTIDIRASKESDGAYTVNSVNYDSGNDLTEVEVNSSFGDTDPNFYLRYEIVHPIQSIDAQNKAFVLSGDLTDELEPPYRELVTLADGSQKEIIMGGLSDTATIEDIKALDDMGNAIPNSKSGAYKVIFDNIQLQDHIDPDIEWYQGGLRVKEDASQLPPPEEDPSTPNATVPERKKLEVRRIDQSQSTLELVVYDPGFDTTGDPNYDPVGTYVPIETGNGVHVNFHPSYRLYLKKDTEGGNNFEEPVILPDQGEGKKETFMGVRSFDSTKSGIESPITPPTTLLALEIVEPEPPGEPTGPTFATRPDFYGKSTYTFDIEVNTSGGREPHAMIFYRANERAILDRLYKSSTVQQILADLKALPSPDVDFFVDRWNDLVNVNVDPSNDRFREYVTGGYRFPNPDNDKYVIPLQDVDSAPIFPFPGDGSIPPGDTTTTFTLPDGTQLTMKEVVERAIEGAFVPLTEQPVVYAYIDQGTQTSEKDPTIRNANGDLLDPGSSEFDPFPMVRKFNDGTDKVRFTDYKLDGAARNFYFYFAVELSNKLKVSDRSPVSGPIQLVNSLPADPPGIKKIDTRLAVSDLGGGEAQPPGVNFRLNEHPEGEHITGFRIYRSTSKAEAQTVRTMELAKEVAKDEELVDDFEGLPVPLFGEPLFYRIVVLREIENEFGQTEKVPSEPSELFLTNIIDNLNPDPPDLAFSSDPLLAGPPPEVPNVVLRWNKTVHNGRYHVYKMNPSGNWTKIHTVSSNDALVELDLASTDLGVGSLVKKNEADEIIYHRFRVDAENASGLLNLTKNDLVI